MDSRLLVGKVEVLALTDASGAFPIKLSQLFPAIKPEQWLPYRRDYPETFIDPETWRVHIGCYLLRSRNRTILVDTGIGPTPDSFFGGLQGGLVDSLLEIDTRPSEIDTVILTHLHPDHVGWNLTVDGKPMFGSARYLVSQADWDAFQRRDVQDAFPFAFVDQMITPLQELGVLELVSGEAQVSEEVALIESPGHTPWHMSVLVSSGGQKAMILGDVLVHPAQVTEPDWQFAFDMDPASAVTTRRRLLGRMQLEGTTAVQCHFPSPGFGLIVETGGRRHWQSLQ